MRDLDGGINGKVLSKTDLHVAELRARQLEQRLDSSEMECERLYSEIHSLRSTVMDQEEKHGSLMMESDRLHSKQLKASNARIASYISENQVMREELSTAEYRVRDMTTKRLRSQQMESEDRRRERGGVKSSASVQKIFFSSEQAEMLRLERRLSSEADARRWLCVAQRTQFTARVCCVSVARHCARGGRARLRQPLCTFN